MDDRNFDKKSAEEWISTIESNDAKVREQDIYPHLYTWVAENDIASVLDLGSGQGVCSTKIPKDTIYYGVEPNPVLLKRAKNKYAHTEFLEGSAYKIPLPDASVEGVFAIAVWQLLADAEKASHEVSRVLRPGGHFLFVTADPEHEVWKHTPDHIYLRSETELNAVWKKHGLKTTKMGAYRYFWFFEGIRE
jgi:ubiquinone/menaquinone biosynthesis C-methylase UbiE